MRVRLDLQQIVKIGGFVRLESESDVAMVTFEDTKTNFRQLFRKTNE